MFARFVFVFVAAFAVVSGFNVTRYLQSSYSQYCTGMNNGCCSPMGTSSLTSTSAEFPVTVMSNSGCFFAFNCGVVGSSSAQSTADITKLAIANPKKKLHVNCSNTGSAANIVAVVTVVKSMKGTDGHYWPYPYNGPCSDQNTTCQTPPVILAQYNCTSLVASQVCTVDIPMPVPSLGGGVLVGVGAVGDPQCGGWGNGEVQTSCTLHLLE